MAPPATSQLRDGRGFPAANPDLNVATLCLDDMAPADRCNGPKADVGDPAGMGGKRTGARLIEPTPGRGRPCKVAPQAR